jgi:peroxiredoxin
MAALASGTIAPQFTLNDMEGKSVSLADSLKDGPALLAFFKISCPTCQLTLPFVQRIHDIYGGSNLRILGISQDGADDTREFAREFGIKLPMLLDNDGYSVSKAYGLTNVPSLFWVNPDGKIYLSSVGFSKAELQELSAEAARVTGKPEKSIFRLGEKVPAFKPG